MTINSAGDIVSAQDYYAYGEVLRRYTYGDPGKRFLFTEKERDVESGYDYFGARYYDSDIARWTTIDPLWEKYHGWSPYNYVVNNPLINIDPDGRDYYRCDETGAVIYNAGSENSIKIHGYNYRNIGEEYSIYSDGIRFDFNQSILTNSEDVTMSINLDGGQYIPRQFTTDDGQVVSVDFSYITRDGNNAYNSLDKSAVSLLISGINEARNDGAGIQSVGISTTTNGQHSSSKSNHYVNNGARAFDISTINGLAVGNSANSNIINILQNAFNNGAQIRENYGPALKTKNGQETIVGGHSNHIHISVNR